MVSMSTTKSYPAKFLPNRALHFSKSFVFEVDLIRDLNLDILSSNDASDFLADFSYRSYDTRFVMQILKEMNDLVKQFKNTTPTFTPHRSRWLSVIREIATRTKVGFATYFRYHSILCVFLGREKTSTIAMFKTSLVDWLVSVFRYFTTEAPTRVPTICYFIRIRSFQVHPGEYSLYALS